MKTSMHIRIRFSKLAAPGLCLAAAAVWQVAVRATSALAQSSDSASFSEARERDDRRIQPQVLQAQVVARGIPGAGAIMQVGTFQQGGPFRDNPAFIPFTQSGAVLHHDRILVASSSNFGAPLARPAEAPGSVLSLDISSGTLAVPPNFAAGGGQATALGGAVILYVANSPAFVNGLNNPQAATAALPSASLPLGISFNNGFGRPWFANAPAGSNGYGTITVIDGNGRPLAGAPSAVAGGVFADDLTNRSPASTHGLTSAALATALITKSPDGSGRAVFLAACADGSVVQVHVEKGVDGLAPPWSFTPIQGISVASAQSNRANDITRVGMLFNWAPKRKVFVTDPLADRILVLELSDDGTLFQVARRSRLRSEWLDKPVDMAPAAVEVGTRNFASNTTPGVGSDLYILNRGNNSIVRMTQEGRVVAVGRIHSGVPGFTAGGIAVSPDARTIYVSGTTPQAGGVVLAMPAFGSGFVMDSIFANTQGGDEVAQGVEIFSLDFTEMEGLGPAFNEQSCARCHFSPAPGGMGTSQESFVVRVARIKNGRFDDLGGRGGPIARQFALPGCDVPTGVPPQANAISRRSAMTLRGTSLLDFVADRQILAVQAAQPAAVRGRQNILADGRPGRFGWKAQTATLVEFIGEAMRDEMAVTNPIAPRDLHNRCGANENSPEADGVPITALVAFLNTIDPPDPGAECLESQGAALFGSIGCAVCHTPSFAGPGRTIRAYTDLLLHNMGTGLADGFEQGSARANEFRTAPLWRVSDRSHFLHDGRAATVLEAIQTHGGQASSAVAAFNALTPAERQAILEFLDCL